MPAVLGSRPAVAADAATLVLAVGYECGTEDGFAQLAATAGAGRAAAAGRPLAAAVEQALAASDAPVCVVPMTLGRDPSLVADAARALRWLAEGPGRGRVALAEAFGTADHLVGWLRAAAGRVGGGPETAILITSPASGPFEEADLFRVARLVRQFGHRRWVEVAFTSGDPDVAEGVERCRRLGASEVALVAASFAAAPWPVPGAGQSVALLAPSAIAGVVAARRAEALHRLGHGDDGIAGGLDAEHGHGFAHSHGEGEHGHSHEHAHSHV